MGVKHNGWASVHKLFDVYILERCTFSVMRFLLAVDVTEISQGHKPTIMIFSKA